MRRAAAIIALLPLVLPALADDREDSLNFLNRTPASLMSAGLMRMDEELHAMLNGFPSSSPLVFYDPDTKRITAGMISILAMPEDDPRGRCIDLVRAARTKLGEGDTSSILMLFSPYGISPKGLPEVLGEHLVASIDIVASVTTVGRSGQTNCSGSLKNERVTFP